ncbi:MAG: inositol monophosphatase family protein [Polyangiales bacterium]
MTPSELEQLTRIALGVAEEAAQLVLRGYRTAVAASEKARSDLVTEHDIASERLIRQRLHERTPGLAVVGEEEGGTADGPTWYCDPIDGTTNFVHGHPFYCVSLGLMERGVPLLGAVVAPSLHMSWHGYVGGGAFRGGIPCRVSTTAALRNALLGTGFHPKSQRKPPHDNLSSFAALLPEARGIRRCGSAALDLCMVADGTYDAYWERALSSWDAAGGAALVLAAGGRITNLRGGPVDLSIGHLVASNGLVHDALLALLPEGAV